METQTNNNKQWYIYGAIAVVFLLLGAGAGWGLKPESVKIEEKVKVVEVEKQVVVIQEQFKVEVVKVKDTSVVERWRREKKSLPDGTVTEVEEKNIDTVVKQVEKAVEVKVVEVEKQVVVDREVDKLVKVEPVLPQWRAGVSGGVQFVGSFVPVPEVGIEAGRRIAGPFWLGVYGRTNTQLSAGSAGLSLTVEF